MTHDHNGDANEMVKNTAVEWLVSELIKAEYIPTDSSIMNFVIQTAKRKEKEQICAAYRNGRTDEQSSIEKYHNRTSLEYFNETWNKTNTPNSQNKP